MCMPISALTTPLKYEVKPECENDKNMQKNKTKKQLNKIKKAVSVKCLCGLESKSQ